MSEQNQQPDTTPGLVSWNELVSNDVAGSKRFYSQLFGWKIDEMQTPAGTYNFLKAGERPVGGLLQMPPEAKGAPTMWMAYITVADLRQAVARAASLGAKVCKDVTAIPEMGSFAIIADPQGATFGLWEFARKA